MLITNVKKSLVGLFTLASSCVMLHAAAFISDFNSGQPPGTAIAGSSIADSTGGVGNSGVLKITTAGNGEAGGFAINDFVAGAPVTKFQARFKLLLGGGTCCGNRMADGISLNFANGINAAMVPGEEGVGTGVTLTFDTWDNAADDTAPAIDIRSGGAIVAFQAMDPGPGNEIRDLNRAPAGPVFLNNDDHPMSIFTVGAAPAPLNNFVDVVLELSQFNGSNTLSLSFSNQVVFNHVPIDYTPIAGGTWVFGGRTGGANEAAYIEDLGIYVNQTAGPATVTTQPVDVTAPEGQPASFTFQADGTPPYSIQWYRNGVAIPGATGLGYTVQTTSFSMNGDTFYAEISNPETTSGPIVTDTATLTVNKVVLARAATTKGNPNAIYVTFSKPVNLDGTFTVDGGVSVSGTTSYGASHSEVVVDVSPLTANSTYHITVAGVTGEDGSLLFPASTVLSFFHGFGGPYCTDFSSGVPVNSTLYGTPAGTAYISGDGILHIMDNINGVAGAWIIDNLSSGNPTDRWHAKMKVHLGEGSDASRPDGGLADGLSLAWGSDLPNGTVGNAEDGAGTGISVSLDTWDDGSGYDPSIEVRWKGNILGHVHKILARTNFVDFEVNLDPDGTIDVAYDGDTVFNNLPIPGFTPIANARFGLFGRTGGMNMNAWVDNFCLNNFTLGPVTVTQQPVDVNAREGQRATYTVGVDGTPPYTYQWYKDSGTLIPGATGNSYTTPPATAADEGSTYYVVVSNDFSTDTSGAGALHVQINPLVVSVFSRDDTALGVSVVHVLYSRPVDLFSGSYDVSVGFEGSRDYGVDHKEVVVTLDTLLAQNQTYTITISAVADETDPSNTIDPDPTVKTFFHGFGRYCNDFTGVNMPLGAAPQGPLAIYGTAYITNGVVHLNDALANQGGGTLIIQDPAGGSATIDRIQVRYSAMMGGPGSSPNPADGYSLSIGPDVPNGVINAAGAEEGAGTGLIFAFDNYDNVGGANPEAPAVDIKWGGNTIGHVLVPKRRDATFQDVYINVDSDGTVDLIYGGIVIYNNFPTPFRGFRGARYGFSGRTGGEWENHWIDSLCINGYSLGAISISSQPADGTFPELGTAIFTVGIDGVPPYTVQWYSNNVAIPGATALSYDIFNLDRHAEGSLFHAVVSNESGTVTTRDAVLHVSNKATTPTVVWVAPAAGYSSLVFLLSEAPDLASAATASNYSVNGVTVTTAAIIPGTANRYVRLTLSGALNPANCNVLSINGLKDITGYNVNVSRNAIQMGGAAQASGANNLVVLEAEAFSANRSPGISTLNNRWSLGSSLPGSVNGYVESTPDLAVNIGSTTPELTTAMDYPVNFPAVGTYYILARGATTHNDGTDNSLHLLVDGASQGNANLAIGNDVNSWGGANPNDFGWVFHANGDVNLRASVNIATPGLHLLTVSMREDGLKLDRFLLTTDINFTLPQNDPGPAASAVTPTRSISITRDIPGNATLSWQGTGWTLQGTPAFNTTWQDLPYPSGTVIPVGYFGTGATNVFFRLICK